jgi:hypothetical protein
MTGFLDTKNVVAQLSGNVDLTGPWHTVAKGEALINNTNLAVCVSHGGKYSAGGVFNLATEEGKMFAPETCEIGTYSIPAPELPTLKPATASGVEAHDSAAGLRHGTHVLRLPDHLAGTTIAVHGIGGSPLVRLSGPGLTVNTPSGSSDLFSRSVFLVKDEHADTTYITLYSPHGGAWTVSTLKGSPVVSSVRAALPAPRAQVKAKVSGKECERTLTYSARVPAGESVALYAENGTDRSFLGKVHKHGRLRFSPDIGTTGAGKIVALEMRGAIPRSERAVAKFATVAMTKPERISGLRLRKGVLSWTAACDAANYTIVAHEGKQVLNLESTSPNVKLPALSGSFTVTVTAVAANGVQGSPKTQKLGAK